MVVNVCIKYVLKIWAVVFYCFNLSNAIYERKWCIYYSLNYITNVYFFHNVLIHILFFEFHHFFKVISYGFSHITLIFILGFFNPPQLHFSLLYDISFNIIHIWNNISLLWLFIKIIILHQGTPECSFWIGLSI